MFDALWGHINGRAYANILKLFSTINKIFTWFYCESQSQNQQF